MFGGNSNWRGPVWFPMNLVILRALLELHRYYGDDFKIECPTGSGIELNLLEVAIEIGAAPRHDLHPRRGRPPPRLRRHRALPDRPALARPDPLQRVLPRRQRRRPRRLPPDRLDRLASPCSCSMGEQPPRCGTSPGSLPPAGVRAEDHAHDAPARTRRRERFAHMRRPRAVPRPAARSQERRQWRREKHVNAYDARQPGRRAAAATGGFFTPGTAERQPYKSGFRPPGGFVPPQPLRSRRGQGEGQRPRVGAGAQRVGRADVLAERDRHRRRSRPARSRRRRDLHPQRLGQRERAVGQPARARSRSTPRRPRSRSPWPPRSPCTRGRRPA